MTDTHSDEIRKQFGRQAARFNDAGRTLSSAEYHFTDPHPASREIALDLDPWLTMTGADPEVRRMIHREWTEEIDGGPLTGMRPFRKEGGLMFLQRWTTVIGVKQAFWRESA